MDLNVLTIPLIIPCSIMIETETWHNYYIVAQSKKLDYPIDLQMQTHYPRQYLGKDFGDFKAKEAVNYMQTYWRYPKATWKYMYAGPSKRLEKNSYTQHEWYAMLKKANGFRVFDDY